MLRKLSLLGRILLLASLDTRKWRGRVLALLTTMLVIHTILGWRAYKQLRAGYQDFTSFYTAGKILSRGQGVRLYDASLQYRTQAEFAPEVTRKGLVRYIHIPAEAAIFVALTKLPFFSAYLLWDLVNLLALAGALVIARPKPSAFRSLPLGLWVLLGFAFFPAFIALLEGQDVLLLLLLCTLTYSALRKNATFAAGCWLGLGLFRFTLVVPLVLVLARRSSLKLIGGFVASAALLASASAAVAGWRQTLLYPVNALRVERTSVGPTVPADMPNLRGLIETTFSAAGSRAIALTIAALSLALLWHCFTRMRMDATGSRFDLSFSLAIIASVLSSYHAYVYDLSVLLIPALLIANYCLLQPTAPRKWAMAAPIVILFLTPLHMALWFRMGLACLWAPVLLVWFWAITREMSRGDPRLAEAYPRALP